MDKTEELKKLEEKMESDESLPLKKGATRLVFGVGSASTKILLVGEGPGYWEDQKGEPFVGNAGKLLDKLLESIGLRRKSVYITNVVHHRPPGNRDPLPDEISAYGKYLDRIIEIINPKLVLTLGRYSMAKFLPGVKISSVHGTVHRVKWHDLDLVVVPMYHPAASLRNPEVLRQEKEDFLKLLDVFEMLKKEKEKEDQKNKSKDEQMDLI